MLLHELRAGTRPLHEALEAEMDLLNRTWDMAVYRRLLGGFYGFLAVTEPQLGSVDIWGRLHYALEPRLKLPLLKRDLQNLQVEPVQLPFAAEVPRITTAAQALGYMYVIEGSTLGGQLISRFFRERLGIEPESGGAYFAGYGEQTGVRWKETLALLEAAPGLLSAEEIARERFIQEAVETASATFAGLRLWLVPRLNNAV